MEVFCTEIQPSRVPNIDEHYLSHGIAHKTEQLENDDHDVEMEVMHGSQVYD